MPHAAIFDLDGTILDTLPDLGASLDRILNLLGLPTHSLDEYRQMVGNGVELLVKRALPQDKDTEFLSKTLELFKSDYTLHQFDLTRPYPGIPELLEKLENLGWPLAVLSNKDHQNTVDIIEHYFPGRFKHVLGKTPQRPAKPDTQGALWLSSLLGNPADIFYFGDSDVDMITATKAGFVPIGVAWGFRSRQVIQSAGAKIILEKPQDFFSFLETFPL